MSQSNQQKAEQATWFSIGGNLLLVATKALAGIFGNSYALIADAIESTTDVFASVLVLLGLRYARRPADENHPYGHGKIEPLITFMVVAFLVVSATAIAWQSIEHIRTPHKSPAPWTLIVLGIIILWKEASYRFVHKRGEETGSTALKADAWHHRSDALTSVAAFIGISLALILGEGYEMADDWAALFASALILYNSYLIFRPALGEVMDEHRYDELVEEIRQVSASVEGIIDTEKCFVRKAGMEFQVDLHAIVDGEISVKEGHEISHILKDELIAQIPQLNHVLIHIEPSASED